MIVRKWSIMKNKMVKKKNIKVENFLNVERFKY